MPGHIPCSVNMITRNSAKTLGAALESVSDFAEIVVGDGRAGTLRRKDSDGLVTEAELSKALDPRSMTEPERRD